MLHLLQACPAVDLVTCGAGTVRLSTDLAAYWNPGAAPGDPAAGAGWTVLVQSIAAAGELLDASGRACRRGSRGPTTGGRRDSDTTTHDTTDFIYGL